MAIFNKNTETLGHSIDRGDNPFRLTSPFFNDSYDRIVFLVPNDVEVGIRMLLTRNNE